MYQFETKNALMNRGTTFIFGVLMILSLAFLLLLTIIERAGFKPKWI